MKKIAVFHPQMTTFGGGELISLVIAETLSEKYGVDIITPFKVEKEEVGRFFGIGLKRVNIRQLGFFENLLTKTSKLQTYKYFFYVRKALKLKGYELVFDTGTNGMFNKRINAKAVCYINFTEFHKKKNGWKRVSNFLITEPKGAYVYDLIISNSEFTRKAVKWYSGGKDSIVLNPPVNVKEIRDIKPKKKENKIVTIGRFSKEKKHEILIEAFKKFHKENREWELHIIGTFEGGKEGYKNDYFTMLKNMAEGFPVFFHINVPHKGVLEFVSSCKIYWHARGYGETAFAEMENFGICTVEGMAAGCVPIVINLGAQPEIVEHGKNGYCWNEPEELIGYTQKVVNDGELMKRLSEKAREKSLQYDISIFREKMLQLIDNLME